MTTLRIKLHTIWFQLFLFVCLFAFRAAPAAYGGYQARGLIGATVAGLRHSHSTCPSCIHHVSTSCPAHVHLVPTACTLHIPLYARHVSIMCPTRVYWCHLMSTMCLSHVHHAPITFPHHVQIWATSATYTTAHGNTGSLTHWVSPGIEPATSWILVRFMNGFQHPISFWTNGCSSKSFSLTVSAPPQATKLELLFTETSPFHFWLLEISFLAFKPIYLF